MESIEQMIKRLCPNGVEYVKLGEVGKFYGGLSGKSKNDFVDGNAKFITYMNVYCNPSLCVDVEDKVVIKEGERQNTIQYGDVLFTGSSETPDECGMSSVLTTYVEEDLYLNSFCFGYRFYDLTDINPHFLKHLFRSASLRKAIAKTANGVTRFNVSKKLFAEIEIPLPPLEIQSRIVEVLDKMTTLTAELKAELEAELEARKQQYEYYRNKLLTFNEIGGGIRQVTWKKISEICVLKAGKAIKASELSDIRDNQHQYPCYGGNGIRGYIAKYSHEGRYAIIGRQGALCGCVNWVEGKFYATEHAVVCTPKTLSDTRFLYFLFKNENLNRYKSQGAQPGLSVANLYNIMLPIPPLSEQQRIVSILDRFEALTTDLQSGLPAEIEARRQQYEYYRNKLLTFDQAV